MYNSLLSAKSVKRTNCKWQYEINKTKFCSVWVESMKTFEHYLRMYVRYLNDPFARTQTDIDYQPLAPATKPLSRPYPRNTSKQRKGRIRRLPD